MQEFVNWLLDDPYRMLGFLGLVLVVSLTIRYNIGGGGKHRR